MKFKKGPSVGTALVAVAAIALFLWFPHPTWNQSTLKAIKAESQILMATHPIRPPEESATISESEWPPAIAGIQPYSVVVHQWGVDIGTKPYFDGGWGYGVPRNEEARRMLTEWCYSEAGQGVLWHGPC